MCSSDLEKIVNIPYGMPMDDVKQYVLWFGGELKQMKYEDLFRFMENGLQRVIHPELHWRLLDRTKHGRVHVNANHVKVEFYIKHSDYANGRDLADILASEIETMGESLSDMDLAEEVEKCC